MLKKILGFIFLISTITLIKCTELNTTLTIQNDIGSAFYDIKNEKYLSPLTKEINPKNTILAFDLHEVLFNRNFKKVAWCSVKVFFKGMFWYLPNPNFWDRCHNLYHKGLSMEGIFNELVKDYPHLENFRNDFFEISNACCYPNQSMIDLLQKFKSKGFKVFLLSNIGEDCLIDFKKRFEIMNIFDGFYVPGRENCYICKPSLDFYKGFKKYLSIIGHEDKQILFFDDLEKNVIAAFTEGIASKHFIGYNDLCDTLKIMKIIL